MNIITIYSPLDDVDDSGLQASILLYIYYHFSLSAPPILFLLPACLTSTLGSCLRLPNHPLLGNPMLGHIIDILVQGEANILN